MSQEPVRHQDYNREDAELAHCTDGKHRDDAEDRVVRYYFECVGCPGTAEALRYPLLDRKRYRGFANCINLFGVSGDCLSLDHWDKYTHQVEHIFSTDKHDNDRKKLPEKKEGLVT